uniref:Uncharacterized protein n=1 Tax=Sphingomonas sp. JE1 TaxID=1628059 RepID=A0A0D4ZZP0_9SPHN|nr:hypothetical protein pJE1_083 [Sphingomonas sp. JE1]
MLIPSETPPHSEMKPPPYSENYSPPDSEMMSPLFEGMTMMVCCWV